MPHLAIPQHPFLATNGRSNMHNDAYMTDTYEIGGPSGVDAEVTLTSYSIVMNTCVTVVFDSKGRLLTTSAVLLNFEILLIDPESMEELASYQLPSRSTSDPLFPYGDTSGAAYFVLDNEDRVLLSDAENAVQIIKYDELSGELVRLERYDLSDVVVPLEPPAVDHVQMTIPDWQGRYLWFTTRYGVVGTIDEVSSDVRTVELSGEEIQNSFSVGEDGVYVISDHAMYRFNADETGLPVIDWRTEYDRGTRIKPGNFNQGSGTTPTLLGEMVAIADNAEPRMNIIFLRRADGSVVCQKPVFGEGASTTENGLLGLVREGPNGLEYSVIADNNYGIDRENILGSGRCWESHAGGLARVDLIPDGLGGHTCDQVWESPEKSSQVLPKLSLANGLIYIYTYQRLDQGDYTFFLSAVELETGETAFAIPTGEGLDYANFGPPMTLGPEGTAYLGTMGGLLRVRDRAP